MHALMQAPMQALMQALMCALMQALMQALMHQAASTDATTSASCKHCCIKLLALMHQASARVACSCCEGGNTANTAAMSQTNTAQTFRCAGRISGLRLVQSFPPWTPDTLTLPPHSIFGGIGRAPTLPTLPIPRDANTARIVKHGYHVGPDVQPPRSVEEI